MSALAAVETLRERRLQRNRNNAGAGMRYGTDGITSAAEEAASRLAQADADRLLVEAELLKEDEEEKAFAAAARTAPARLQQAAEAYVAARRHVEIALRGGVIRVEPGTTKIEVTGLLAALENLVPARSEYDQCFAIAAKLDVLGDHRAAERLAVGRDLHRLTSLAASA